MNYAAGPAGPLAPAPGALNVVSLWHQMNKNAGFVDQGVVPNHVRAMAYSQPAFGGLTLDRFLQDVFKPFNGMNWTMTQFLLKDISRMGRFLNDIFPIMLWKFAKVKYADKFGQENGDMVEVFSEWILEAAVYGQKAARQPARIYDVGRRHGQTRSFIARGGGFQIDKKFALDPTRTAHAMKQLQRMGACCFKTLMYEMVSTFVDECIRATVERTGNHLPMTEDQYNFYLHQQRQHIFVLHKMNGMKRLEEHGFAESNEDEKPDFMLCHHAAMRVVYLMTPKEHEFALVGPKATDEVARGLQLDPRSRGRTPMHGWRVGLSVPFLMGDSGSREDPTVLLYRFGLWYAMEHDTARVQCKTYCNQQRDIRVINIAQKRPEVLSFRRAMQHLPCWKPDGSVANNAKVSVLALIGLVDPAHDTSRGVGAGSMTAVGRARRAKDASSSSFLINNWNYRAEVQSAIKGAVGVSPSYARACTVRGRPWHSDWNPTATHKDGLPNFANLYTMLSLTPGALAVFLQQVRGKGYETIAAWERIVRDTDPDGNKAVAGGGYGGRSGGRMLEEPEYGSSGIPEESGGGGGGGGSAGGYSSLTDVLGCHGDGKSVRGGLSPSYLAAYDYLSRVGTTRLMCGIITQEEFKLLAAFIVAAVTQASTETFEDIANRVRNVSGMDSADSTGAVANIIDEIIGNVKSGVSGYNFRSMVGPPSDAPSGDSGCGKSDDELKVLAQRSRISRQLCEWHLEHNIHINLTLLNFQPDITVSTCGVFIAKVGKQTGCLAIKDPEVSWVVENNDDVIEVGCAFKARLLIAKRENLLFANAACAVRYHGGGGTGFQDAATFNKPENQGRVPEPTYGIFVVPERQGWVPRNTIIAKPGFHHTGVVTGAVQPHYTCYQLAQSAYRFVQGPDHPFSPSYYVRDPYGERSPMRVAPNNSLLFKASWEKFTEDKTGRTFWEMEDGDSPLGNRITVQTAGVLHGEFDVFDTVPDHSVVTALVHAPRS